MRSNIPPALSPVQWKRVRKSNDSKGHAAAARKLYLQRFGFTERMVQDLHAIANLIGNQGKAMCYSALDSDGPGGKLLELADRVDEIRFRIQALLPPPEQQLVDKPVVITGDSHGATVRELDPERNAHDAILLAPLKAISRIGRGEGVEDA